jgi:hypothetical protein
MAYNDHLMPKLSLIIVRVNVSFQNVRGHQLPPEWTRPFSAGVATLGS